MQVQLTITKRLIVRIVAAVLLVALAVGGFLLVTTLSTPRLPEGVDGRGFQAVTLQSGEVYFGRLRTNDEDTLRLTRTHVIRQSQAAEGEQGDPEVVPLSDQLHAPRGTIIIRTAQITSIQPLRKDSIVVKAIEQGASSRRSDSLPDPDPAATDSADTTPGGVRPPGNTDNKSAGAGTDDAAP